MGQPRRGRPAVIYGDVADGPFGAVYADEDGIVVGAMCIDDARTMLKCRKAIKKGQDVASLQLVPET